MLLRYRAGTDGKRNNLRYRERSGPFLQKRGVHLTCFFRAAIVTSFVLGCCHRAAGQCINCLKDFHPRRLPLCPPLGV